MSSEQETSTTLAVDVDAQPTGYDAQHYLVARDPAELERAHGAMKLWASGMVEQMKSETAEHLAAYEIARKNKWASARLQRLHRLSVRRQLFYEKTVAALGAGYMVVPNFQMDTFMVRTSKAAPTGSYFSSWHNSDPDRLQQAAEQLPQGQGQNRNPIPDAAPYRSDTLTVSDGSKTTQHEHRPLRHWRPIEFPVALAKSAVMSDAAKAAGLKLFDEMGIAHDKAWQSRPRKGDPMILGRLLNPRPNASDLTFFIAWAIDLTRI